MFKEFNYVYSLLEANDPTFEMSEKKKDKDVETKQSFNFGKLVKGYVADWVYRVTQLNTILEREMKLQWSKPNLQNDEGNLEFYGVYSSINQIFEERKGVNKQNNNGNTTKMFLKKQFDTEVNQKIIKNFMIGNKRSEELLKKIKKG